MAFTRIPLGVLFACSLFFFRVEGTITVAGVTVDESAGTATVTVMNDLGLAAGVWGFTYETVDGTATAGNDYVAVASSVKTVPWPTATADLTVTIVDDNDFDPNESFTLSLTGFFGAEPDTTVTITIADNERTPLNLTQPMPVSVREGSSNVSVTFTLESAAPYAFNATVSTMDGTAEAPADYAAVTDYHVSVAAGDTSIVLTDLVYINDDSLAEPSENFSVVIYSVDLSKNYSVEVTIDDDDTPVNSHCKREGQNCLNNGTCDEGTGVCACPATHTGPNCAHALTELAMPCDNSTCVNGYCITGPPASCVCNPGYAGEQCDKKAYYHQCNNNNISVCITPFSVSTFAGNIFVSGMRNTPGCTLTLAPNVSVPGDGIPDFCMGYAGIFEYNGTCGVLGPVAEGSGEKYVLVLDVRYSAGIFRPAFDEVVTFTCVFNSAAVVVQSPAQVISGGSSTGGGGTKNGGSSSFVPATQVVASANGQAIQGPVTSGDKLSTCVSVNGLDNFNGIIIKNITINNNRTGSDRRERVVYVNGCDVSGAGLVSTLPAYNPSSERHTLCFMLETFTFEHDRGLTNPALAIVSTVQVFELASNAIQPVCPGRRKRSAETTPEEGTGNSQEEQLTTVVYLTHSKTLPRTTAQETACAQEWLMPAMIGLGIVTITMAVVIIILVYTVIRQFKQKQIA
ncbi:EGF-like domain-containing protein 2 [Haliotis asinina]|uniref:EGF-like domain-containing protein 2 n=1 Tax=Haliotis asinina TaxID=109174 RepID=UPI003531DF4B